MNAELLSPRAICLGQRLPASSELSEIDVTPGRPPNLVRTLNFDFRAMSKFQ